MRIIREILEYKAQNAQTNIDKALRFVNDVSKKKAVIFLISDFIDDKYEKVLAITNRKHDLIAINITDEREQALPDIGLIEIEDSESGNRIIVNTGDRNIRKKYADQVLSQADSLKKIFGKNKIDSIELMTHESYIKPLYAFFKLREGRTR